MYKAPIDIIYGAMKTQLEGDVLKAVQRYGINVDKDELIRALQYDRGQYEKGYRDGKADAVQKWIPVTERLPETQDDVDWVLVNIRLMPEAYYGVPCVAELRNGDWYDAEGCLLDTSEEGCGVIVTHWMPLPEPPKGE